MAVVLALVPCQFCNQPEKTQRVQMLESGVTSYRPSFDPNDPIPKLMEVVYTHDDNRLCIL